MRDMLSTVRRVKEKIGTVHRALVTMIVMPGNVSPVLVELV